MTSAERQAKWRQRQTQGLSVVALTLDVHLLTGWLLDRRILTSEEALDRDKFAEALERFLHEEAGG